MKHSTLSRVHRAPTLALAISAIILGIVSDLREARTLGDVKDFADELEEDQEEITKAAQENLHSGTANTASPELEDLPDGHPLKPVPEIVALSRDEQRAALQSALDDLDALEELETAPDTEPPPAGQNAPA